MRAEVALISSNVVVTANDGATQRAPGGENFGCRLYAFGTGVLRLSNTLVRGASRAPAHVTRGRPQHRQAPQPCCASAAQTCALQVSFCGQAGLLRPAVMLDRLTAINPALSPNLTLASGPIPGNTTTIPNPSFVDSSAITFSMDGGLEVVAAAGNPVTVTNNVLYISFDRTTVSVKGAASVANRITGNLALGTIKDMSGERASKGQGLHGPRLCVGRSPCSSIAVAL